MRVSQEQPIVRSVSPERSHYATLCVLLQGLSCDPDIAGWIHFGAPTTAATSLVEGSQGDCLHGRFFNVTSDRQHPEHVTCNGLHDYYHTFAVSYEQPQPYPSRVLVPTPSVAPLHPYWQHSGPPFIGKAYSNLRNPILPLYPPTGIVICPGCLGSAVGGLRGPLQRDQCHRVH